MDDEVKKAQDAEDIKAEELYPGAAIDAADDDRVDKKLVDERTDTLNCNCRN